MWIREKKNDVYKAAADTDDEAICLKCKDATEELLIIKCKHTFCESCLDGVERDMDEEVEVSSLQGSSLQLLTPFR
jgi:RING-type zinc-finger